MWHELIWAAPFAALILCIAILPLVRKSWWEKNYPLVSLGLGLLVIFHYLLGLKNSESLIHTGIEYLSFIALIGSLYVVAGGIHIHVKGESTPLINCSFLAIGAIAANFLGTTGASMVLIRPWIRMNKYRLTSFHIVFFIFIISNVGGALTPIGDPPLFLGYLKGVPFFWVLENAWPIWLTAVGILLAVFFVWDSLNFSKAPKEIREKETGKEEEWRFGGMHNIFFLLIIISAAFVNHPHFLREAVMILAAFFSYRITPKQVHEQNHFKFGPIKEVAILFLGIFATMIPALEWLEHYAPALGIRTVGQFFWCSGSLSAVLDNAPTYLNFLSAATGLFAGPGGSRPYASPVAYLLAEKASYILAISVGSVFFGAVTYIGNGPNFLVKSIADAAKAKTPSFFSYFFRFSLPILIPLFILIWVLFFRV